MHFRVIFFCILCFLTLPARGWTETALKVSVEGVEGKLYDNIMVRLRINIYSKSSVFNDAEIGRLHRQAPADIESALAPFGYYAPSVKSSLVQNESGWQATYMVQTGSPVTVSKITVVVTGAGKELPELSTPQDQVALRLGEPLRHALYEDGKRALIRRARALGFLDAYYSTHEIRIHRDKKSAEIELILETGSRYIFGKTSSDQELITRELLMRFLSYQDGDYFTTRKLFDTQRDLYRTDYFSSVIVDGDTANPDGTAIPVKIALEPLEHYNFYGVGVGYASDIGAYATLEWRNPLFNKKGHRVSSSFLVGERETHCVLNYRIPVADPRFNTFGLSGLWNRESWEDTVSNALSAGMSYEYLTPRRRLGISIEALDEDYRVGDTKGESKLLIPSLQGSMAIADDVVNTKNGVRVTAVISGAQEGILSDTTYLKLRGDGRVVLSPFPNWRLLGHGSAGVILVDSIDDLPPSLRFYAGGNKSVRGYRYKSLGPVDSSGTVIGGTYLLSGSIECERRISELWRVSAFYDVGNAMDDPNIDLAHGVGIGVGIELPFGKATLDFAYPLTVEGSSQYVFFSVGADL